MRVITINLHRTLKILKLSLKLCAFLLALVIAVQISSGYIENSLEYKAAVVEAAEEKTIIIDAGHGGEDCGAIGVNGCYEKDLNLEIANILGEMFEKRGYAVVYTRLDDKLLYTEAENIKGIRKISDLKNRCKIGAEHENAIYISIHMNTFSEEKYSGLHVYYSENNKASYPLAISVQGKVKSTLQENNNRVPKPGKNMYLLENLNNPAILIECGFLSNKEECNKLSEKEYQKQLSFSILCGIIEYIEKN